MVYFMIQLRSVLKMTQLCLYLLLSNWIIEAEKWPEAIFSSLFEQRLTVTELVREESESVIER